VQMGSVANEVLRLVTAAEVVYSSAP